MRCKYNCSTITALQEVLLLRHCNVDQSGGHLPVFQMWQMISCNMLAFEDPVAFSSSAGILSGPGALFFLSSQLLSLLLTDVPLVHILVLSSHWFCHGFCSCDSHRVPWCTQGHFLHICIFCQNFSFLIFDCTNSW